MTKVKFKTGDIGFSSSEALLSKIIKFFTSIQTKNAKYNHAFTLVDCNIIVEAVGRIRITPLEKYDKMNYVIYRLPLSKKDREKFKINMLDRVRVNYGWFKLPLFMFDAIATSINRKILRKDEPIFWFTKYFSITSFPVCSQFIVWGLHKFTDYRLKDKKGKVVNWKVVSPDYLEDLLKLSVNKAKKIYLNELDKK